MLPNLAPYLAAQQAPLKIALVDPDWIVRGYGSRLFTGGIVRLGYFSYILSGVGCRGDLARYQQAQARNR